MSYYETSDILWLYNIWLSDKIKKIDATLFPFLINLSFYLNWYWPWSWSCIHFSFDSQSKIIRLPLRCRGPLDLPSPPPIGNIIKNRYPKKDAVLDLVKTRNSLAINLKTSLLFRIIKLHLFFSSWGKIWENSFKVK